MQQDVQQPSNLVDIKLILNIGDDTSLDNSEYYDQILYLKREDDNLEKGIWDRPLIEPKWREIIDICKDRLSIGPDLILGARYIESCASLYNLEGFLAGMIVLQKICLKNEYIPVDNNKRELTIDWINNKLKNSLYLIHTLLKDKGITQKEYAINNTIIDICKSLPFNLDKILNLSENLKESAKIIDNQNAANDNSIEGHSADYIEEQSEIKQDINLNIKKYIDGELNNIKENISNISKNLSDLINTIKDKDQNS